MQFVLRATNFAVSRQRYFLAVLLAAAFIGRVGVRLDFGEENFWQNSYSFYYALAENVISGKGFCFESTCAFVPPLYPLFLTLSVLAGKNYLLVVIPQALMGMGTALFAFLIGRQVFNASVGLIACALAAVYPYYVMHDTALQETGMLTFCTALSVWLLLRASRRSGSSDWALAGLALGAIPLVRASVAPAVVVALVWIVVWGAQGILWQRLAKSLIVLAAVFIVVGPWLLYTYRVTGSPVLSIQTGTALWVGNNPETFSHYPAGSMDRSRDEAWSRLTPEDLAQFERVGPNVIARGNWFKRRALKFMEENPWLALQGAIRKLGAAFSPRLNPHREPLAQAAYAIGYVPVAVLGIAGMFLARRRPEVALIGMLFLAFMGVTAVFWAHTSHRSYLDIYWMIFAAFTIENLRMHSVGNVKSLLATVIGRNRNRL